MSEKGTKPGTPAIAQDKDDASPANKKGGKMVVGPGKSAPVGVKKAGGATPRGAAGSAATGRRGGALVSPEPPTSGGTAESKEPTDDEYLRQLYAEQQEADRVSALQAQHSTLSTTVAELHRKIAASESKHVDALMHRKREKQEAVAHTKQLTERIEQLEAQVAEQQALAESTAASTASSHSHAVMLLEDRMGVIQAKYESLHQFKSEKADLEHELATLKQLLAREKDNHALNVSELERRNVMEKDKLKNEMLRKIRETKLSLLAMTEDQLHTTTKRTIMENEMVTTELQYQSKETERIVRKNQKLATENASLKRELELAAATTQQMAKKTMFFQNLIAKLQAKLDVTVMERDKQQQQFTNSMQHMQAQVQFAQGQSGAGSKFGANDRHSSLSGILRGVEEMNALTAAAAASTTASHHVGGHHQGLPLLPKRSMSQQSQQSRKVDSRASHVSSGVGMASPAASTAQLEELTRLAAQLAGAERDRQVSMDQVRQMQSALREERSRKEEAEHDQIELRQQLSEMTSALARARSQQSHSSTLSGAAVSFIASCLEEQRMGMTRSREVVVSAERDERQATLASVVADGTDATLVVRAAGEKAVQGAAALQVLDPAAPPLPVVWDETQGYPSSLASFRSEDKERILAHLLEQLSAFQRTHPSNTRDGDDNDDGEHGDDHGDQYENQDHSTPQSPSYPPSSSASSVAAYPPSHPNPNSSSRPRSSGGNSNLGGGPASLSQRGTPSPTPHIASGQRSAASSRAE